MSAPCRGCPNAHACNYGGHCRHPEHVIGCLIALGGACTCAAVREDAARKAAAFAAATPLRPVNGMRWSA